MYQNLLTNNRVTVQYNFLFLMRRVIFAVSAIFLTDYPLFQLYLLFAQSFLVMIFVIKLRPFDQPLLNRLEIFNEICIYAETCLTILFTDLNIEGMESNYNIAWIVILILFINFAVNFAVLIAMNLRLGC
jgi:hypothetical protein